MGKIITSMYSSEQELVDSFKHISKVFARDILGKKPTKIFVIEEFDSQHGVADIVIGSYKPHLSRKKIRKSINFNWVSPLGLLNIGDKFESTDFMSKYDISMRAATKTLSEYVTAGFLKQTSLESFTVVKPYEPITETVVSIEAKIKNWKKALTQAKRYQRFSNISFVLLDERYSCPAIKNIDMFVSMNIGLMTMKDHSYTIHFTPDRKEQESSQYFLRFNEVAYSFFKKTFVAA
jgi:hypothetical protein